MRAMVLDAIGQPLRAELREPPRPGPGQVLVEVAACAVCRTDLHVVDGDLEQPRLPLIPGHEIVGRVVAVGDGTAVALGSRVGIPWLGHTCGVCRYCRSGRENLCLTPVFTGYQTDGGYATHALADAAFCFPLPDRYDDVHAAPLLCAGLIGHRALKAARDAKALGIYGFGAAGHIIAQIALREGRRVHAFTTPHDISAQRLAMRLGCSSATGSDESPPEPLDAAIIFAPVGDLVPAALRAVAPGGTVVLAGIHMSTIPAMPYELLWGERVIRSIANLTRADATEFMQIAAAFPIATTVETFPLANANEALERLRSGQLTGAAVLIP